MADHEDRDEQERRVSRLGFAFHGIFYLLLALLAGRLMLGSGGSSDPSASGALSAVADQPFGRILLVPLGIGFAAYAGARWMAVVREDEWTDRLTNLGRAIIWSGLALLTARTLLQGSSGSGSGGQTEQNATAAVLGMPGGVVLVSLVGLVVLGVGLYQAWHAVGGDDLAEELDQLGLDEQRTVRWLGRAGYVGRGLAYGIVGGFVVQAAITHDPSKSGGLDKALQEVQQSAVGVPVLLTVTLGFLAFGIFRLAESRYRFDD